MSDKYMSLLILGVSVDGIFNRRSAIDFNFPPELPVKAIVIIPAVLASENAQQHFQNSLM